jgi:hypothetical protein
MTQNKVSSLTKVASQMGKKGGKSGTGSSKKRGIPVTIVICNESQSRREWKKPGKGNLSLLLN